MSPMSHTPRYLHSILLPLIFLLASSKAFAISVSPNPSNFGTVVIGNTVTINVTITSVEGIGNDLVNVNSGGFIFNTTGCSAASVCSGSVTTTPGFDGTYSGSVELIDAGTSDTVNWNATATGSCPAGQVWDGESQCIVSDIDNDGVIEGDQCPTEPGPASNFGCPIPDRDDDGVLDQDDNCPDNFNPSQTDADNDGLGNACDDLTDSDDDGIANQVDNCVNLANPDQIDLDEDGIGDACDPNVNLDQDADGISDDEDNCPSTSNPNQEDLDSDGIGDACDNLIDSDSDGIADIADNCPTTSNADQLDLDLDGIGDACDANVVLDQDSDGINSTEDNCPTTSNPDQADLDEDGIGDACDPVNDNDLDNDGIDNEGDNCPLIPNPGQADLDGDGAGDACDTTDDRDSDSDGISDSEDSCPLVAGPAEHQGCPLKQALEDVLQQFTDNNNQSQNRVVGAIASTCSSDRELSLQIREDCARLLLAAGQGNTNVRDALRRITPEAAVRSNRTVRQGGQTQIRNVGGRIAGLRNGAPGTGGGFSLSGFNLTVNDEVVPIGRIASALEQQNNDPQATTEFSQSRLGIFITGDIAPGKRKQTEREPGFDFDTYGVTAGMDYRFTDWFILGAALGYMNTEADLDGDLGDLETEGYSLTLYGSYFPGDNYYIDFALTWGQNDFDQRRNIRFSLNDGFDVDQDMQADYDGDMYGITIGTGYDFRYRGWDFGPRANIQYLRSDTDSFTEKASSPQGAGAGWAVQMDDYEQEWLTLELGGRLAYTVKASWGILIPYAQLDYLHEFDNDAMVITGRFAADTSGDGLSVLTDDPDRNYFRARIGTSAQWANGVAGFIDYSTTLSDDLWERDRINFGLRWEF